MATKAEQLGVTVRRARISDARNIAKLSGELGYPSTAAKVVKRLRAMKPASHHAVFVAATKTARVVGWLHISVAHLLESGTRAELNGLIVSEAQRSLGAGAQLLAAAEAWAKQRKCTAVNLRSNVIRERAHKFYLRQGYEHYKTQKAFWKAI
ncbi:MAG: GNAT family N-acetyltransferase [Candidatus Acidiferrum sp.]|jgi:GNAT superfamily N-acetyltransferase